MDEMNLAHVIAGSALEMQAEDLEIIDVSEFVDYADFILVCGGRSERQVRAIVEAIQKDLKKRDVMPLGVEGLNLGRWVLMDFGAVVVHVFLESARSYYDIEGLWMDAKRLPFDESTLPSAGVNENQRGRCASGS